MSKDYNKDWEETWKDICTNKDGTINLEQIKKELSDYKFMLDEVPKVYSYITGGTLSKPNYYTRGVIQEADNYFNQRVKDYKDEILEELDKEMKDVTGEYFAGLSFAKTIVEDYL